MFEFLHNTLGTKKIEAILVAIILLGLVLMFKDVMFTVLGDLITNDLNNTLMSEFLN